jgi:RimJ/RimL family protein N-acetyltransferase
MIGRIGFHSAPGPDYLESLEPWPIGRGAVEFGYTIFPEFTGNGYATEASIALMHWARETHGVRRFVLSISPENPASLRIAAKLGFVRIGEHMDPEDGLEHVLVYPAPTGR